jgi:hypothetical protein
VEGQLHAEALRIIYEELAGKGSSIGWSPKATGRRWLVAIAVHGSCGVEPKISAVVQAEAWDLFLASVFCFPTSNIPEERAVNICAFADMLVFQLRLSILTQHLKRKIWGIVFRLAQTAQVSRCYFSL